MLDWTRNVSCSSITEAVDTDCLSCDGRDNAAESDESDVEVVPVANRECALPTNRAMIIIGDNWDKNVKPRDMRCLHRMARVDTAAEVTEETLLNSGMINTILQ